MARSQVAWGLDIGTTSLKAMRLSRAGDKVTIEAFDVVDHERFLSEPDIDEGAIIRATLAKFLERNQPRREATFVGVPGSQTFARFVKLPPVEPKKIPEIVKFEAIQQIPFPLDHVNWDYQTFQSPESPDVEVGIFAMKKELVAQVLANFENTNIAAAGVQMSPLAVFNAVQFDGLAESKGTVVLDIGAKDTNLIFVDHGRLWLRTINIGGNNFTDALAKSFRLSFLKAEELKKTAATSKYARQVYQSMRPVFADLVAEIQRSIGFYNSSHRDSRLERVIGMGNPFKLPNLQKYLAQNLSMEVVRLEEFKKANVEGKLAAGLNENILGLASAYGLALQGLDLAAIDTNLLPIELARKMLWQRKQPWFIAAAALVIAGVGAAGFRTMGMDEPAFARNLQGADAKAVDAEMRKIDEAKRTYGTISNTYDVNSAQVRSYVNLSSDRAIWPNVLSDIFASLPQADRTNARTLESANRHEHKKIMVTRITADYSSILEPAAPAGAATEPAAGAAKPAAGPAAQAATSTRGFQVTITGYTPLSVPDHSVARVLIREFLKSITDKAAAPTPARPFFYRFRSSPPPYTERTIQLTPTGTPTDMVWGSTAAGPFASVFFPQILGMTPTTQPAPSAAPPGGTPGGMPAAPEVVIDHLTTPVEPGTGASMIGDDIFTLQFTVYMAPTAPTKK